MLVVVRNFLSHLCNQGWGLILRKLFWSVRMVLIDCILVKSRLTPNVFNVANPRSNHFYRAEQLSELYRRVHTHHCDAALLLDFMVAQALRAPARFKHTYFFLVFGSRAFHNYGKTGISALRFIL